jgi:predicted glycosyltransferase involved in capsule biosynthesis
MKKKLCVVVPYRDRQSHLLEFVPYMQNILNSQNIDYHILVVEQEDGKPFNRAKLLNVGYDYTKTKYDYYCFHDVDMLPLDSDYEYCESPTHLAAAAEQFSWKLPYPEYFGGVTIFNNESFKTINGYSNEYWGWGAEDDDVYRRVLTKGITPYRKNGRYRSLDHDHTIVNHEYARNTEYLRRSKTLIDTDGLSSLKYTILIEEKIDHYTKITVSI